MSINIYNGSTWINPKNINIYNGSTWNTVNYGKIWNGSTWNNFYTRLVKVAPSISVSKTYNSVTFVITQGTVEQFSEFPAIIEVVVTYPNTLTSSAQSNARVATFYANAYTLYQNQTVGIDYRLHYGDDEYYPEDQSYLTLNVTTDVISVVTPSIIYVGNTTSSLTYRVAYYSADYFSWVLRNSGGATVASDSTETTTGDFTIGGLSAGAAYTLTVTSHYITNFSSPQTRQIASTNLTDVISSVAPTVTFTGSSATSSAASVSFSVNKNGANGGDYAYSLTRDGGIPVTNGSSSATSLTFNRSSGTGVYPDEYYTLSVTTYWNGADLGSRNGSASGSTPALTTPLVTSAPFNRSGVNYLAWNVYFNGSSSTWTVGIAPFDSSNGSGVNGISGYEVYRNSLAVDTVYYLTIIAKQVGYRSGARVSASSTVFRKTLTAGNTSHTGSSATASGQITFNFSLPANSNGIRYSIERVTSGGSFLAIVANNLIDTNGIIVRSGLTNGSYYQAVSVQARFAGDPVIYTNSTQSTIIRATSAS